MMDIAGMNYTDVNAFWFEEIEPKSWWIKDSDFDQMLRDRFLDIHRSASKAELYPWRSEPEGRLAEIIILDQFSRNMFRDTAEAFAYDTIALVLSQAAIDVGADQSLEPGQRSLLYMPFMHSESIQIHQTAVELFGQPGMEGNLEFELKHKAIIERFGRYPHRNRILGRESTADELQFLSGPNSSF